MAVSAEELLNLAQELIEGKTEVKFRCSASRAYYAAFHYSKPFTKGLPWPKDAQGAHDGVIKQLTRHPKDEKIRNLGHLLNLGKEIRHNADYRIKNNFKKSDAGYLLSYALEIKTISLKITR